MKRFENNKKYGMLYIRMAIRQLLNKKLHYIGKDKNKFLYLLFDNDKFHEFIIEDPGYRNTFTIKKVRDLFEVDKFLRIEYSLSKKSGYKIPLTVYR